MHWEYRDSELPSAIHGPGKEASRAAVEVGAGGVGLLVSNGLLKEHETRDRKAVGEACLTALEQWSMGRGARFLQS